jgi:hypothetical protein
MLRPAFVERHLGVEAVPVADGRRRGRTGQGFGDQERVIVEPRILLEVPGALVPPPSVDSD